MTKRSVATFWAACTICIAAMAAMAVVMVNEKIHFMSGHASDVIVDAAIKAGASGIVVMFLCFICMSFFAEDGK